MLYLKIEEDMTQLSRVRTQGRNGRGGPSLQSKLGSRNTTFLSPVSPARCPPAFRGLYFQLSALALWDTTTLHPPDQDPDRGPLVTLSRGKKTSSLQIHSLRLHRAIHLEVRPAMSHLERIILSLRGVSHPKLPSFWVMETHLEPALLRRNQKCLQKQNNSSVMPITMRIKTHLHEQ